MTPVYLNQPTHSFPLADHHQEEDKSHLCFSSPANQDPASSVSCPTSSSIFEEDSGPRDIGKQRWHDQEPDIDDWSSVNCGPEYEKAKEELNRSSHKGYSSSSAKWLMQKMKPTYTCPDSSSTDSHKAFYGPTWQHQRCRPSNYKYNNNGNNMNRVCADCSTTSTPLWRSGPNGPKSLCNACGIRRRKARKAMEEEAGGWCAKTRIVHNKEIKKATQVMIQNNSHQCQRKREVMGLQDFEFTLTRNSVLQPRDEVLEGAMLLMDLSCRFFPF